MNNIKTNTYRVWAKRCYLLAAILLVGGVASGCVVKEMGINLTNSLRGEYYLKAQDPEQGEEHFRREVEADPENALSNYYLGRLLLRSDKAKSALPFLQKACILDPENADYQFWTGVAHNRLKQAKEERSRYERALKLDSEHQQALTSLGHWYLQKKKYAEALKMYTQALMFWPENPAALYNRALALSKLGRRKEEQRAWHQYLAVNSAGALARNAVEHLNVLGDFSYRNYRLGARTITVEQIRFVDSGAELARASQPALEMIGEIVAEMKSGVLQVVVYQKGDVQLAKARAVNIRKFLLKSTSGMSKERIGISWFGEPQRNAEKKWNIDESVDFFVIKQ